MPFARLARALDNWKRSTPDRARQMYDVLKLAEKIPNLPTGVSEIIEKSLGAEPKPEQTDK